MEENGKYSVQSMLKIKKMSYFPYKLNEFVTTQNMITLNFEELKSTLLVRFRVNSRAMQKDTSTLSKIFLLILLFCYGCML